jgi:hypothetical protein
MQHPFIKGDRTCRDCTLGKGCCIPGAGPDDLREIRLVVLSDHPGYFEQQVGYPMYDNAEERKPKYNRKTGKTSLEGWKNAGGLIRSTLEFMYGLDTYRQVWMTNALKCDPEKEKVKDKHLKACAFKWLQNELLTIDSFQPEVPILIAGNDAFKSLTYLDKELGNKLGTGLRQHRRTSNQRWRGHPLIFTYNPAAVARSEARIETEIGLTLNQTYKVNKVQALPTTIGSPLWMFLRDLEMLEPFLLM